MSKKVVLLLFVSFVVLCQNVESANVETSTWHHRPRIKVTSPNGGETCYVDSTYKITWKSWGKRRFIRFVRIEYSTDNASTWNIVTKATRNDGSYRWIIPNTPSDYCLVKISDLDGHPWDKSNSVFSIVSDSSLPDSSYINVLSPNGGEEWLADTVYYITWNSYGTSGAVSIEYSPNIYDTLGDSIANWTTIVENTADDGSYLWFVPNTPSNNCLVRITDVDGDPSDVSDDVFSILPPAYSFIEITSPNGGEEWYTDTVNYITWNSYGTSGAVSIEYSTNIYDTLGDSIANWTTITNNTVDDGSYLWLTPPDISSNNCLVRITDVDGSPSDMSDDVFAIIPPDSILPDSTLLDSSFSNSATNADKEIKVNIPKAYSMHVKNITASNKLIINYATPKKASVNLTLYDLLGVKVEDIADEKPAGFYSKEIKMNGKPGGVYFIRIQANGNEFVKTSKVLFLKNF